jgi:hypothetical protein
VIEILPTSIEWPTREEILIHSLEGPDGEVKEIDYMLKVAVDFYKIMFRAEDRYGIGHMLKVAIDFYKIMFRAEDRYGCTLNQCSKNRPICQLISRLIVNHWLSDKITTYRSNLSPWPIYQSYRRYFDQNIPNVDTYDDFVDDSSVREMIFGPLVLYSLCSHLIRAFSCCLSSLVVSTKTKRRE